MNGQLPSARPYSRSLAKPKTTGKNSYPHNHLQSLLDGFVDFSGVENYDLTFKGLSINSKKVHEEFLFLACAGVGNTSQHGIAYAGEAINSGANCIAWEPTEEVQTMPISCPAKRENGAVNVPLLRVVSLQQNLGEIASRFYKKPSHLLNVIGITGTNGKTSTAHFIAHLVTAIAEEAETESSPQIKSQTKCAVIGTLGNGFYGQLEESTHTTPDAVTLQALLAKYRDENAETLVMEVSSHALAQGRVNGVEFDCAILTNLTRDHLDYHGNMQAYADEKLKLFHFSSLKNVILNQDDAFSSDIRKALTKSSSTVKILSYSRIDSGADYFADSIHLDNEGISFSLQVKNNATDKKSTFGVKTHLVGDFNVDNLLAAIAVLHFQGTELKKIISGLENLSVVPGRMEKVLIPNNDKSTEKPLIVVDYAHTPDALEKGLCALKNHTKGKLVCIFGCGGDRDKGKRPLMAAIAQQYSDRVVVTNDNPRTESAEQIIEDIQQGFDESEPNSLLPGSIVIELDRKKAIYRTLKSVTSEDVILIAGKGHEDYQEIKGERFPFSDKACVLSFYDVQEEL